MALTATVHRFEIELADIDRGVYESLDFRVARHPSEDEARVVVRVLARAVAHEDGLEFGRGLSTVEDPALWTRTPTGEVATWIDVGLPSAERLHRASKRADRVLVFTHKLDTALSKTWSSRSVHRAETIEIVRLPIDFVTDLAEQLERNVRWYITVQDGLVSVTHGERSIDGQLRRCSLAEFLDGPA